MSLEGSIKRLQATLARWEGKPPPKSLRATPKEKLARLLEAAGFDCNADEISHAKGYWTHAHQDCLDRWTVHAYKDGKRVEITGTDTISECARFGIEITPTDTSSSVYGDFECIAKPKPRKTP